MASTATSTTAAIAPVKSTALAGSISSTDYTTDDFAKEAVTSCMRAWNYAHNKRAEGEKPTDWECRKAGNKAFLKALPLLSGHKNICDFIACISYASLADIISDSDATHHMANARVALAALSLRPKPQAIGAKSGGKPAANQPKDAGE